VRFSRQTLRLLQNDDYDSRNTRDETRMNRAKSHQ